LKKTFEIGSPEKSLSRPKRYEFPKDCLDMDDLIQTEFPDEYIEDKHEEIMKNLVQELMESRTREMHLSNKEIHYKEIRKERAMKNDDFLLLLCLLKKKKEQKVEKSPYHVGYSVKLENVYVNEKQELVEDEEKVKNDNANMENFVKTYILNDNVM
jgi:hypothetical protein